MRVRRLRIHDQSAHPLNTANKLGFHIGQVVYAPAPPTNHYKRAEITGFQSEQGTVSVLFHPSEPLLRDVAVPINAVVVPPPLPVANGNCRHQCVDDLASTAVNKRLPKQYDAHPCDSDLLQEDEASAVECEDEEDASDVTQLTIEIESIQLNVARSIALAVLRGVSDTLSAARGSIPGVEPLVQLALPVGLASSRTVDVFRRLLIVALYICRMMSVSVAPLQPVGCAVIIISDLELVALMRELLVRLCSFSASDVVVVKSTSFHQQLDSGTCFICSDGFVSALSTTLQARKRPVNIALYADCRAGSTAALCSCLKVEFASQEKSPQQRVADRGPRHASPHTVLVPLSQLQLQLYAMCSAVGIPEDIAARTIPNCFFDAGRVEKNSLGWIRDECSAAHRGFGVAVKCNPKFAALVSVTQEHECARCAAKATCDRRVRLHLLQPQKRAFFFSSRGAPCAADCMSRIVELLGYRSLLCSAFMSASEACNVCTEWANGTFDSILLFDVELPSVRSGALSFAPFATLFVSFDVFSRGVCTDWFEASMATKIDNGGTLCVLLEAELEWKLLCGLHDGFPQIQHLWRSSQAGSIHQEIAWLAALSRKRKRSTKSEPQLDDHEEPRKCSTSSPGPLLSFEASVETMRQDIVALDAIPALIVADPNLKPTLLDLFGLSTMDQ